jgi:glycosyltransferase involved in cell wall biosynthesis
MEMPSISIIIPTYNSEKVLPLCLESIQQQKYPKEKIEILVVDDGSVDNTVNIAKNFGAKILYNGARHIERGKSIGIQNAENDLVLFIDSDNILPSPTWISEITNPFLKDKEIVGAEPIWFNYDKKHSMMDRYCSLFGINDPLAFYLNRRDRLMQTERQWTHCGEIKDKKKYFLATFKPNQTPTLGSIGFIARKKLLLKTNHDPLFFHMDACYELITMGHCKFALMKLDIIHLHSETVLIFMQKIKRNMSLFLKFKSKRKYPWTTEPIRLFIAIFLMTTLIKPTYDSVKGYLKKPDVAWFLHPPLCVFVVFIYSFVLVKYKIVKTLSIKT